MRNIKAILGLAVSLAVASPLSAQITPVMEYTTSGVSGDSRSFTLGYAFNLSQATTVNALGYWTGTTLTSQLVGIWDINGTLLTSGSVSAGDPIQGHYAWDSITPLVLTAGDYVIGGEFTGGGAFPVNLNGITTNSDYTWLNDRQIIGGFAFPNQIFGGYGNNGIALVNFSTGQDLNAAVPEPATWAMMLIGFGAVGVSMRRRRKMVAQLG